MILALGVGGATMEGFFQPIHLLIIFFIGVMMFGIVPFIAGYFVGSHVERKKWRKP